MRTQQHLEGQHTDIAVLRAVTAAAADVFTAPPRRQAAYAYLRQRGIDATGIDPEWVLGYAPSGWTRLVDELRGQFDDQALIDAGVARRSSRGSLIDTFRDRVIFGIHSTDGTIAGFLGRDLSGSPTAPKYLNTHQHALFDKSSLLYGLHEATRNPRAEQPVIVEGPLDVLAITSRQVRARGSQLLPVAASGTSFTPTHARRVAEVAFAHQQPVVVAMDGDAAGRAAGLKAGEQLRRLGLDVRIATLPSGTDPAEYLARVETTLDAFRVDTALPLLTAQVQHAIAAQGEHMQWVEGRLAAARVVSRYLATYPPSHSARQIAWIADALQLDPATVSREVAAAYRVAQPRGISSAGRSDLARPAGVVASGWQGPTR